MSKAKFSLNPLTDSIASNEGIVFSFRFKAGNICSLTLSVAAFIKESVISNLTSSLVNVSYFTPSIFS